MELGIAARDDGRERLELGVKVGKHTRALRAKAWEVKKRLLKSVKSVLPTWLKYSEVLSIHAVRSAWPPSQFVKPEPLVYWPSGNERDWFARNGYLAGRPIVLPPILLHEVPDGILFPDTGTIGTSDGWLIQESCPYGEVHVLSAAYNRLRLRRPRSMGRDLITSILVGKLGTSYGHWIVDALPRLWALSMVEEPVFLILPDSLNSKWRRLIELALPANVEIRDVPAMAPVSSRRVLLTPFSTTTACGLMRPEIVAHLRGMVARAGRSLRSSNERCRQIYISREKTDHSRVTNESELKTALLDLGIESVVAEDLALEEQILLFSQADLVVGALGSGLLNCLFQPTGGALVEIFAGGLRPGTHTPSLSAAGIAISVGLMYTPVYHSHPNPEPSYTVDVPRICRVVSEVQRRQRAC